MTRPNPTENLMGFLEALGEQTDAIGARLDLLLEEIGTKTWTVKDLAKMQGVSRATVLRDPWRMPHYGLSDIPGQEKRWQAATVKDWQRRPLREYREEWDAMDFRARQRAQTGRAA